jgi:hypothetical protein
MVLIAAASPVTAAGVDAGEPAVTPADTDVPVCGVPSAAVVSPVLWVVVDELPAPGSDDV